MMMNMNLLFRIAVVLTAIGLASPVCAENMDSVLNVLDACLKAKERFAGTYRQKTDVAERKAVAAEKNNRPAEALAAWADVYRLSSSRDGDRALRACSGAIRAAEALGDVQAEARFQEKRALIYGLCGFPWEGKALLDSLNASARLRPYLARSIYTSYYDLYDYYHAYMLPEVLLNRNYAFLETLEDSIKKYVTDPAELAMTFHHSTHDEDAMIAQLKTAFGQADEDRKGIIATTISNKFFLKRDISSRDYYWALAAVYNTRTARRDNEALTRLAARMFELGDTERALRYARYAYDDAVAYHSRSRVLEAAPLLAESNSLLSGKAEEAKRDLRLWQATAGVLFVTAGWLGGLWLRIRRKSGAAFWRQVADNETLRRELEGLRGEVETKGEYVSRFLDLSLDETYRLEQLKGLVLLKLQAGETERLKKMMKDPAFPDGFRQQCLRRFDIAFLRLYPQFTKEVNRLLVPEERIELPDNEVLNNDFRVLAFMRLGITDSQKIATILGVSVNTVYFYRNKLRRKAHHRESFESDVMNIESASDRDAL